MTKAEMHTAVKLELDKSSSLQIAAFEPEEIDYWIDQAQIRFVETKLKNLDIYNLSESDLNKIQSELGKLYVSFASNLFIGESNHYATQRIVVYYSDDVRDPSYNEIMVLLALYGTTQDRVLEDGSLASTDSFNRFKRIKENDLHLYLESVENKPLFNPVFYTTYTKMPLIYSTTPKEVVHIVKDRLTPSVLNVYSSYIKYPTKVSSLEFTDSLDFPEHCYADLAKLTALLMIENIESPRIQTYPQTLTDTM